MRTLIFLLTLLIVLSALVPISESASESTDTHKIGPNQGLTFEDLGRGLKSAAKNIGDEVPKIRPAIGETFKKVMRSEKEKNQPKEIPQNSTKSRK